MLSKIWFCTLGLAAACRLGAPRPDGSGGSATATASGRSPSVAPPAEPTTSAARAPAVLTLPSDLGLAGRPSQPLASAKNAEPSGDSLATAPAPRAPRRHQVAVLGDSLSDPRVGGGGYVSVVAAACPDVRIENLAKGGFMVNQMRRRFEAQLLPRLPGGFSELVVFGGVNDLYSDETALRTVEKIRADLSAIYRAAKGHGLRVIALTVTPWGGFSRYYNPRRAAATRRLNDWIRAQVGTGLVDVVLDSYPLLACDERLCPEYEAPFRDGLHFGKLGQQKLGDALVQLAFADCDSKRDPRPPTATP